MSQSGKHEAAWGLLLCGGQSLIARFLRTPTVGPVQSPLSGLLALTMHLRGKKKLFFGEVAFLHFIPLKLKLLSEDMLEVRMTQREGGGEHAPNPSKLFQRCE